MILIDSFGWIEWITDGPLAEGYEEYLRDLSKIVTPTVVLYEVYKKILAEGREREALVVTAQIRKTKLVQLTAEIALLAAEVSLKYRLPTADSIVYATAIKEDCSVVTSDPHFENLPKVVFLK
jgi:predicted nucleic acid-binding protein